MLDYISFVLKKRFISFGKPYLGNNEINSVKKIIRSSWIGTGFVTKKFEEKFSNYKNSNYSISLNSCTAGLHISLLSLGLKKNDEIITTPMTFAATINSIILAGGKPILTDIRRDTFNIDEDKIVEKINKKTRAILVVHFAGLPCNMNKIIKIAKKYKLKIIEDCAHAIETKYLNKPVGNFGYTGCYSFYSNKNITTGEGGMLTCSDKKLAEKIKIMRLHGMSRDAWKRYMPESTPKTILYQHYDILYTGLKYNMIDINAALGIEQLKKIGKMWNKRKKLYNKYFDELKNFGIILQDTKQYKFKHGYHLFLFVFDQKKFKDKNIRDKFLKYLNQNRIGAGVHYRSVTGMTNYRKLFKWSNKTCPIAHNYGLNTVSLPLYPSLSTKNQNYIINRVKFFLKNNQK